MKMDKINFILWKITIKHNFCRGLDPWDWERPVSPKAQHREGPMQPRPITPGLAHIVKVRHGWDEISSLIKWARVLSEIKLRSGQIGPNTNRPAKGKAMRRQSNQGQYQALSMTLGNSLSNRCGKPKIIILLDFDVVVVVDDNENVIIYYFNV